MALVIDEDTDNDAERSHGTEVAGFAAFSDDFDAQFTDANGTWKMEVATAVLPATTGSPNFQTVTFRQAYSSPPVVVTMAPKGGSQDPTAIVIRNVTATGFEAVQVEAPGANGVGPSRTIHYLAMDAGAHELPDGTRILADTVSITDQQHGSGVTGTQSWHTETFAQWGSGGGSSPLPASQVMSYDANGNRSSINELGTLYSYNNQANSNRLLSTAGPSARTYSYDAAGNVIGDGTYSYGYDDRGRLVDVDNAISYRHNGLEQRVEKDDGTDTRLFVYDDAGNLIGEYDDNGVAIVEHVWFAGAPVAILEGSNAFYVHTDHLGTPRTITDGNTAIWRWQSDPFGSTLADEDADGDGNPLEYNLRFPGQYYDDETGLHYNYFRTYDPSTGRYLESDPIGLRGGMNTYAYVFSSPTNLTDSRGLAPDWSCNCEVDTSVPFVSSVAGGKICAYKCRCACEGDFLSKILPFDIFKRSVKVRSFSFNVRTWNGENRRPTDVGDLLCFGQTDRIIDTPRGPRQAFERFAVDSGSSSRNTPWMNYDGLVGDLSKSAELEDCVDCSE